MNCPHCGKEIKDEFLVQHWAARNGSSRAQLRIVEERKRHYAAAAEALTKSGWTETSILTTNDDRLWVKDDREKHTLAINKENLRWVHSTGPAAQRAIVECGTGIERLIKHISPDPDAESCAAPRPEVGK